MKKYKVFLASSAELSMERKEVALMISRLNNAWVEKDLYLELVIWEDLLHSFRGERIQDYFNREMLKCDIVMVLFFKKVGQFTEEEFKLAYDHLKKGKKPHFLFVYFKSGHIAIEDVDEDILKISKLKKEIQQYEQIYGSFNSIEDLTQKFRHQLELPILEKVGEQGWKDEAENLEKRRNDLENYNRYVKQKFQYLDFTGLNAILQKPLKLESVYVKLKAQKYLPFTGAQSIREFKEFTKKEGLVTPDEDFTAVFKRQLETSRKEGYLPRMLIVGHPGSGKTTLMKWIALRCVEMGGGDTTFSGYTPVFIPLKELGNDPAGTFRKRNIGSLVMHLLERANVSVDSFLDHHLKANRLLFLMDGLDEIGDETVRREVIDWIQKQYTGQNPVIVTSRFSGIHETSGLKFRDEVPVFAIRDFKMKDVETFVKNWYRNIEITVAGEDGTQKAIEEGDKKSKDLIETIKNSKNLKELGVNPLLLTIIAVVHRTRAVLPRDRYKLYEECLKVMIELWNMANRKVDISFSFENSIAHLSNIAVRLMETDRREMDKTEIEECCLPARVEGQTRDFFLKEMVLKAGLLYESEGKYGFLHLTFQEYLAAWYLAKSKNQNSILRYYDKDYWEETFKLFVNIGNSELLFEEIIENFLSKEYWKKLNFWEELLEEIVIDEIQKRTGIRLAGKILDILDRLDFKEKNDILIIVLLHSTSIFKYSGQLSEKVWHLFNAAKHPFVQSIGSHILNEMGGMAQKELLKRLEQRIKNFENQTDKKVGHLLDFLIQNNNTFLFYFTGRRKLLDYYFVLRQMKSSEVFIQYLVLLHLRFIDDIRKDIGESIFLLPFKGDSKIHDLPAFPSIIKFRDFLERLRIYSTLKETYIPVLRSFQNYRKLLDYWNRLNVGNLKSAKYFNKLERLPDFQKIIDTFQQWDKAIISKHQNEIIQWADFALERLHKLSKRRLLELFPNTTEDELKQFRESYLEIIANELSKGNCDILIGKTLTKKTQKRIEELVTFDEKSVERMLDFELDIPHEEEKHTHHLKAFEILGNKDYEKLYTIIHKFIRSHPDDSIRLHALYIMKNML